MIPPRSLEPIVRHLRYLYEGQLASNYNADNSPFHTKVTVGTVGLAPCRNAGTRGCANDGTAGGALKIPARTQPQRRMERNPTTQTEEGTG
jgi:hypothetical protein